MTVNDLPSMTLGINVILLLSLSLTNNPNKPVSFIMASLVEYKKQIPTQEEYLGRLLPYSKY